MKVSVGEYVYNLTKNDKIQSTDKTIIKFPNSGEYLLQHWNLKCSDINGNGKYKSLFDQQKQAFQRVIQEQQTHIQSGIVLCI